MVVFGSFRAIDILDNHINKKHFLYLQLDPVSQIPQAAPTMERPNPKATPKFAYPYGDMWVNTSAHPWLQYSDKHWADELIVLKSLLLCCYYSNKEGREQV
jgi:hypothetical protein